MKFGLIGKTLSHSFSAAYFSQKFSQEGLAYSYHNIELATTEGLLHFKKEKSGQYHGLNVTIPYKEQALKLCNGLSPEAQAIGAVNCIKVDGERWTGHNTDAFGFAQSLAPFLESLHNKALVFGTGGASKAVAYALKRKGIKVWLVGRKDGDLRFDDLGPEHIKQCLLLVNCTPVGTAPALNDALHIPYHAISAQHVVMDLIYNPAKTKFLLEAEKRGASIVNGQAMLELQAEKSWEIWMQT